MLWKCSTQYASKFGKLSSGHRTGKDQFSFQSQRTAMPKNAQTTAQLHSSHTLAKVCSKSSKPNFNSTWTMNLHMFKLYLEKAEEPEIKLPTSIGSPIKQESSRKTPISAFDYVKAFDCVDHNKLWKILKEMGIPDHLTCLLKNLYVDQEATVRTGYEMTDWFQIWKGVHQAVNCHHAYLTYMQSTWWEMLVWKKHKLESRMPGEIITSDMQMTPPLWQKKPLDEHERGEWKSWLKAQHSEN